jgi:DNA-binding response OmpR family regulator
MLIYIVEDDDLKLEKLNSFLESTLPNHHYKIGGSFQSGLRLIESETPDLVILDMTLPTFDRAPNAREGRPRPLGGYDLLRKLQLRRIDTKVIILTQLVSFGEDSKKVSFDEITERCRLEFPNLFIDSVYFDQGDISWQIRLLELISELNNA